MADKVGLDYKLYWLSTGTREAWPDSGDPDDLTEVTNCRDLSLPLEHTEIEASDRGTEWEKVLLGLKKGGVEFQMKDRASDTVLAAVRSAWVNKTDIAFAVLNGDSETAGVEGLWADFKVVRFNRTEPLDGLGVYDITLKPSADSSVDPEWVTVTT